VFRKLKALMFESDIDQKYLCKKLGKSQNYVTPRMMGRQPWSMEDVYIICDLLKIPYEQIPVYFPRGGVVVKE
jgi:transcriptional regulator with XRE-family HTH domain